MTAPRGAMYGLNGNWEVEGHGIPPDYDVDLDPAAVRQGHDPQLEKAVAVVMELLSKNLLPKDKSRPIRTITRQTIWESDAYARCCC